MGPRDFKAMKIIPNWIRRLLAIVFQYGRCDSCSKRAPLSYVSTHRSERRLWQKQSPAPGEPNHGETTNIVDYRGWVCGPCWKKKKLEECPDLEAAYEKLFKELFPDLADKEARR